MDISSIISSLKWFLKASDDLKFEYFKVSKVKLKITYKTTENVIFCWTQDKVTKQAFFYLLFPQN